MKKQTKDNFVAVRLTDAQVEKLRAVGSTLGSDNLSIALRYAVQVMKDPRTKTRKAQQALAAAK